MLSETLPGPGNQPNDCAVCASRQTARGIANIVLNMGLRPDRHRRVVLLIGIVLFLLGRL